MYRPDLHTFRPSSPSDGMLYDLFIHRIRCKIDFTWPRHRTLIDKHALEKALVPQRREHAGQLVR